MSGIHRYHLTMAATGTDLDSNIGQRYIIFPLLRMVYLLPHGRRSKGESRTAILISCGGPMGTHRITLQDGT